jgi:Leucine-rich repeat (LRR) protein
MNVSGLPNLNHLQVSDTSLTSIDLTKNAELQSLSIVRSSLDSLNLAANTKLSSVILQGNRLKSLSLATNRNLTHLDVRGNSIAALNLSAHLGRFGDHGVPETPKLSIANGFAEPVVVGSRERLESDMGTRQGDWCQPIRHSCSPDPVTRLR